MRILSIILIAALLGGAVGGALAYVEVRSDRDTIVASMGDEGVSEPEPEVKLPRVQVDEPNFYFGQM